MPSCRTKYSDAITVLAGEAAEPVIAHKNMLCRRSDFFVAACSNNWVEGREKTVRLETVDVDTFSVYVEWAYTGNIDLHVADEASPEDAPTLAVEPEDRTKYDAREASDIWQLVRLYVAADMLLDVVLKNKITDELTIRVDRGEFSLSNKCIPHVWDHTAQCSGIRRFFIDLTASLHGQDDLDRWKAIGVTSEEFLFELAKRLLRFRGKPTEYYKPSYWGRCTYHDHGSEDERSEYNAWRRQIDGMS